MDRNKNQFLRFVSYRTFFEKCTVFDLSGDCDRMMQTAMNEQNLTRKNLIVGNLCALGCEILYGLSFIFTKQAVQTAGIFALLGWRFFTAAVFMNLCMAVLNASGRVKIRLLKPEKLLCAAAALFPTVYYISETLGIRLTTASESGVFIAAIPVVSLAASAKLLHRKPTGRQTSGIFITLAGILFTIIAVGMTSSFSIPGYLFLMGAVLSFTLYSVLIEKITGYGGLELTRFMLTTASVVFILCAVLEAVMTGGFTDGLHRLAVLPFSEPGFGKAVLYQGIGCSVIAFFLTNTAIRKIGVIRTNAFVGVSTLVSILSGTLFLKEPFTLLQTIGAVLIIAGVYIAGSAKTE